VDHTTKSILEMNNGAYMERADYEVANIIRNIRDANTKATKPRKLVLEFTFTPDDRRENIGVSLLVKPPKLEPTVPVITMLHVSGEDSKGVPIIAEMTPQMPGQVDLGGEIQEYPAILKIADHYKGA
jgi:hypothetical protein